MATTPAGQHNNTQGESSGATYCESIRLSNQSMSAADEEEVEALSLSSPAHDKEG